MTMKVEIVGPNLPALLERFGSMHVHADGCADLRRGALGQVRKTLRGGHDWQIEVSSVREVVESCYGDQIAESDGHWEEYVGDLHFAPCTSTLPRS